MSQGSTFTGRARRKQTRWTVLAADIISRIVITVGGIGTIISLMLIFLILFAVAAPLFTFFAPPSLGEPQVYAAPWKDGQPVRVTMDEYRTMAWVLYPDGKLQVVRLDTGATVDEVRLFEDREITAASFSVIATDLALAFNDGTVQTGKIEFDVTFHELAEVDGTLKDLPVGGVAAAESIEDNRLKSSQDLPANRDSAGNKNVGVVQRTPQGQFRLQTVKLDLQKPMKVASSPLRLIDHLVKEVGQKQEMQLAIYSDDGSCQFVEVEEKDNFLTGEVERTPKPTPLPLEDLGEGPPSFLSISGRGDNVMVAWEDGHLARFDIRNLKQVVVAEEVNLLPASDAKLTVCQFILGRETLICGDSEGGLTAWFRVRSPAGGSEDGFRLTAAHRLPHHSAAVRCAGISQRSRMVAVGYDDGYVQVVHVTTDDQVVEVDVAGGEPVTQVIMAPKDDALVARTADQVWHAGFEPMHPEASLASLFLPVWYEGYEEPTYRWQSSFAGVGPEMKLSLVPLIFGTIKATFYSMLFGAPLALLAALYTSEFTSPRVRGKIKPTVEMMASLPSVVLGFLAALVFAPIIEKVVPATLCSFVTIPVAFLLGAYLWQMLPHRLSILLARWRLVVMIVVVLPVGILAAVYAGPTAERLLFAGDIKRWLDGQIGNGTGAWLVLMLPLTALGTWFVMGSFVNPLLRDRAHRWNRGQFALIGFAKFLVALAGTLVVACALSMVLTRLGFDPRGSYVDTYVQRNALIVGFVMGFAVIPIIYTIAEDALSTVPQHLRSASLGAGATPWQTAIRVVIPTAMSGLFSALMIGLGRAVGETMIVLMAGGNTPVMEWNMFNGFRTLSANIAVELPEAVQNSTHFRTLFLAALTLFVLTFTVNTVAEIVRLRFRRRAVQL